MKFSSLAVAGFPLALMFCMAAHSPGRASTPDSLPPADLIVDYVSDMEGAIEPCDCPANPIGGVSRRGSYIHRAASRPGQRLLVAGGNFFPGGPDAGSALRGQYVLKAFGLMGYQALGLGDYDFRYGSKALLEGLDHLPVVATNVEWRDGGELGQRMLVKEFAMTDSLGRSGRPLRVAILSFIDEQLMDWINSDLTQDVKKVKIQPAQESARSWLPKARKRADVVVALVHMSRPDAAHFATQVPGFDLVVAGKDDRYYPNLTVRQDSTWVVSNTGRGLEVNELRFSWSPEKGLFNPVPYRRELDATVGEDSTQQRLLVEAKHKLYR